MRLVVLISLAAVALATCVVLVPAESNVGVPSARLLSEKVSDTDSNRVSRAEQGTEERFSIQWVHALLKRLYINFKRLFGFRARAVRWNRKTAMSTATRGPVSTAGYQKTSPTSSIPSEAAIATNLQDGEKVLPDATKILAEDVRAHNAGKSENTEHTLLVPLKVSKGPEAAGRSEMFQRSNSILAPRSPNFKGAGRTGVIQRSNSVLAPRSPNFNAAGRLEVFQRSNSVLAPRSPNFNAALIDKEGLPQVGETHYYKLMDTGKTPQKDPKVPDLTGEIDPLDGLPKWFKPGRFGNVDDR